LWEDLGECKSSLGIIFGYKGVRFVIRFAESDGVVGIVDVKEGFEF
jgi:hypothetical protein